MSSIKTLLLLLLLSYIFIWWIFLKKKNQWFFVLLSQNHKSGFFDYALSQGNSIVFCITLKETLVNLLMHGNRVVFLDYKTWNKFEWQLKVLQKITTLHIKLIWLSFSSQDFPRWVTSFGLLSAICQNLPPFLEPSSALHASHMKLKFCVPICVSSMCCIRSPRVANSCPHPLNLQLFIKKTAPAISRIHQPQSHI